KEEEASNIFEAAGKMGHKEKEEPPEVKDAIAAKEMAPPAEDLEARFARCKSFYAQIKKTIEDAYSEKRISPNAVEKYLETPTNVPERNWQEIQKTKRGNEEKLKALIPKKLEKKPPEEPPAGAGPKGEKPKPDRPKSGFVSKKK